MKIDNAAYQQQGQESNRNEEVADETPNDFKCEAHTLTSPDGAGQWRAAEDATNPREAPSARPLEQPG